MTDLSNFHPCTRDWFSSQFDSPTKAQLLAWNALSSGQSTLLLSPTGSGKTLAAFLVAIDQLMFRRREKAPGVRVLYITPLKALGVDVERNLEVPLAGITQLASERGQSYDQVRIGIRSGDTPQNVRRKLVTHPPDVLITTPESLYLMLTSQAAHSLATVETIIIDEIHAVVPSKRGTHLSLSLERLETICETSPQRVGLSATQRPLEEIARFLGGFESIEGQLTERPIEVLDAGLKKKMELKVAPPLQHLMEEVIDEARKNGEAVDKEQASHFSQASLWEAAHTRLLKLIKAHTSTILFVNSRILAERITQDLNLLAGEEVALAHHGSLSKDIRAEVELRLKSGELKAMVATSSMELGIDVGAVDLVIQLAAPPSVASGVQRVGRAGHQVGATSRGHFFPKFTHDLLACAALTKDALAGKVEQTRYPKNALDVLAQQVLAIVVTSPKCTADEVFNLVRQAAPYAELPRRAFDSVLDMLAGRYPSERFGELRPRLTWDKTTDELVPLRGARLLTVTNPGTIPDRGLYGVFLAGRDKPVRVGELDEEMVFEIKTGDVFYLGASSWRVEEITSDRVLVTPAPGQKGMMPFWRGTGIGRPAEFGRSIGVLARTLVEATKKEAETKLRLEHGLEDKAAEKLVDYLHRQKAATGVVPSDQNVVVERYIDALENQCVVLLTPFGRRVHAPWAIAIEARLVEEFSIDCDVIWTDDGVLFRFVSRDTEVPTECFFPSIEAVERAIRLYLGDTALFATSFREAAGRALLLPKRKPGRRMPLWLNRRRAYQLLGVAKDFPNFPIVHETVRECVQDIFDIPALKQIFRELESGSIRRHVVDTPRASPFAHSVQFLDMPTHMYTGDVPLAERQALALTLDQAQLSELLGSPDLRDILEPKAVIEVERELWQLDQPYRDANDMLRQLRLLGAQTAKQLEQRKGYKADFLIELSESGRVATLSHGEETRFIAQEDLRMIEGVNSDLSPGDANAEQLKWLEELLVQYARRRLPFLSERAASEIPTDLMAVTLSDFDTALESLVQKGELITGAFLPWELSDPRAHASKSVVEYATPEVVARLRRRSLQHVQRQIKACPVTDYARFLISHHGIEMSRDRPARPDVGQLMSAIASIAGIPLSLRALSDRILPARAPGATLDDIDRLVRSGDLIWRGAGALPKGDARVQLFFRDDFPLLATPIEAEMESDVLKLLSDRGPMFFSEIDRTLGSARFVLRDEVRRLATEGFITSDAPSALLNHEVRRHKQVPTRTRGGGFRRRRVHVTSFETSGSIDSAGRWYLLPPIQHSHEYTTERQKLLTFVLLDRYGVVIREVGNAAKVRGGFSAIYPVFKRMEELGQLRRGYFVEGVGATQFASPEALAELRRIANTPDEQAIVLDATDPANPYGSLVPWPASKGRPKRVAGDLVFLKDGALLAHLGKRKNLTMFCAPSDEEQIAALGDALVRESNSRGRREGHARVEKINGDKAGKSPYRGAFEKAGFSSRGGALVFRFRAEELQFH